MGSWASGVLATFDPIGAITVFPTPLAIWIVSPISWLDICCRVIALVLMIYLIWILARYVHKRYLNLMEQCYGTLARVRGLVSFGAWRKVELATDEPKPW